MDVWEPPGDALSPGRPAQDRPLRACGEVRGNGVSSTRDGRHKTGPLRACGEVDGNEARRTRSALYDRAPCCARRTATSPRPRRRRNVGAWRALPTACTRRAATGMLRGDAGTSDPRLQRQCVRYPSGPWSLCRSTRQTVQRKTWGGCGRLLGARWGAPCGADGHKIHPYTAEVVRYRRGCFEAYETGRVLSAEGAEDKLRTLRLHTCSVNSLSQVSQHVKAI
jgi:hypothetical protein